MINIFKTNYEYADSIINSLEILSHTEEDRFHRGRMGTRNF